MTGIKVALLQFMPEDNLQGNIAKGIKAVEKSAAMGADIALFPEMWSAGTVFRRTAKLLTTLL